MERFTQKDVYGLWYIPLRTPAGKCITTEMIYNRLAAYENTGLEPEEIEKPEVWVGMTLWVVPEEETDWLKSGVCEVESIHIGRDGATLWVKAQDGFTWPLKSEEIGKTAFLTEEEAKNARGRRKK